ncbi:cullin, putative [Trypanosoma brucei gambiense DAL972]|uniref:Cullin, putative n=1 Tax=Trypanosoma brucei gambiense (strain MHOM/CI/86/DAL972) TaxID=679716 RepID=D0A3I2_TRYB9|nr:cullin, putative [Trypanosoma brucei gambiense DAL972]CBH15826.1 cullin, putative [Trypanosoma brucei gambiense DAL972]|eukprot:XP_011778090.1 cullin, putative [Trypanosoma brucei gambiense DAL972]
MLDAAPLLHDVSTEEKWCVISDAVNAIFKKSLSKYSFQQVHHSVFQMCQTQRSGTLFDLLHHALSKEVTIIREQLLTSTDSVLLQDLETQWEDFSAALRRISDALFYLDKNYTNNQKTISQMGESLFYAGVLKNEVISNTFVSSVRQSLEFGFASQKSLKCLTSKLRELYRDTIFEPLVERPLLEVLTAKYKGEMELKLDSLDVDGYLTWALTTVGQVQSDVSKLVGDSMDQAVRQHMRGLLIKENTQKLLYSCSGGGSTMVRKMNSASLGRLADALVTVGETDALLEMLISTTKAVGCELLSEVENEDPVAAVGKVLTLRNNLQQLVEKLPGALRGDKPPIVRALAEIVNECPDFSTKLAYYYDVKARSRGTHDSMDQVAADTFSLYRLLRSKESFEQTFKLLLAARLINCKPNDSLVHEIIFVEHLRSECGDSVANHLDVMIKDGRMRTEINRGFLSSLSPDVQLPLSFDVTVITAGVWPIYPGFEINLPECMQQCVSLFQAYYIPHHNGRVLSFHTGCGTICFTLNHKEVYELAAPTSFVNTILCFQSCGGIDEPLTVKDICNKTKMIETDVLPQLEALVNTGLISNVPSGGLSRFIFNKHFAHHRTKLRIGNVGGNRTVKASAEVRVTQVASETTHAESIQAVLMQIVKRNKTLSHGEMFTQVAEALKGSRITPVMVHIKQNLEILINKGLISRGSRPDIYVYEA